MKKVLLFIVLSAFFTQTYGQACSACVIDLACDTTPAYPTTCPDFLPSDTAQQPYEATLTFYLPKQFQITSPITTTVTFQQLTVIGLTGMPPGLTWSAYDHTGASQTVFYPNSNPPSTERICAKICGTPLVPGYYEIVVSAIIVVDVPSFGQQTQSESFTFPITIFPNPSGNSAFSMSGQTGCGSLQNVDFDPVLVSNGSPLYEYTWDFGDGTTSSLEFPAPVSYNTPGTYTPSLITNLYKYKVTDISATIACEDDWCGDIEEPSLPFGIGCSQSSPDPYFTLNDGASVVVSGDLPTKTPVWSNMNLPIESNQLILSFADADGTSQDDNLGTGIVNINGVGTYNFTMLSPGGCAGVGVTGTITIGKELFSTLSDTDQITIYPLPVVSPITASFDSVCIGDPTTFTAMAGFISYEWYKDTNVIAGVLGNTYTTNVPGNYLVEVVDTNGCTAFSPPFVFTAVGFPLQPLVLLGGPNATQMFLDNQQALITYQWLFNGLPIPGETGTSYTATTSGNYSLQATNFFGCVRTSDEIVVVVPAVGINELSALYQLSVYPNPNAGVFSIEFNTAESKNISVQLSDISGRIVYDSNLGLIQGAFKQDLDVQNLSNGIYTLTLLEDGRKAVNTSMLIAK